MHVVPGRHVAASIHEGGAVFFQTRDGRLFAANRAGARVWQGLAARKSVAAIAFEIGGSNRVACDAVRGDVERFIEELGRAGLVEEAA